MLVIQTVNERRQKKPSFGRDGFIAKVVCLSHLIFDASNIERKGLGCNRYVAAWFDENGMPV
jgi:hypothetical protein